MKKKHIIILAFLGAVILFETNNVFAQKESLVNIESVVTDEDGNPVEGAEIFSNNAYTKSDASGGFSIKIESGSSIVIQAKGFENITLTAGELKNRVKVVLQKVIFLYSPDEKVNVAFRNVYKGDVVGSISTLNATEINKEDNTLLASNVLTGRTLGLLGGNSIRGIGIGINVADITGTGLESGNALFIVDAISLEIY